MSQRNSAISKRPKVGSAGQGDPSQPAKKVKVEAATSPSTIHWEWEDDGSKWTSYDEILNKEFLDAFNQGLSKTSFTVNNVTFDIMFDRMVQRNTKTCWERRIRANTSDGDGGLSGTWQYQDDKSVWNTFDHSGQRLLYAADSLGVKKVSFTMQSQKYVLDLSTLEQENVKTKKKRPIRRTIDVNQSPQSSSLDSSKSVSNRVRPRKAKSKALVKSEVTEEEKAETEQAPEEQKLEMHSLKSVSFTGKAPVDSECFAKEKYNVFFEGATVYDVMLNQTNLKNNNNKFYLMQILESNSSKNSFAVWFRWGRVGMVGQSNLVQCGTNLDQAKDVFCKKFSDKTGNEFSDRLKFKKVPGKYDLVLMDYKGTDEPDAAPKKKVELPAKVIESKLSKKIQDLVELICNVQEMEDAVLEMKYDSKKAPLGKLTKDQIKAGYKALKLIEGLINKNDFGDKLIEACDSFYTRIPHCFGMQRPPLLKTKQQLKEKIELLETLGDIQIALKLIKDEESDLVHPIDQHYAALNCDLTLLDHSSDDFKIVERYTQNTHAKTHSDYKMEVVDVFSCRCRGMDGKFKDVGNRMLLWHGSRLTNYVGILSQGLRIAPPEAPVTGYMFGKGIYFADMSSKSANYCYPTRSKNVGFVMLCEVSLGKSRDLLAADYNADKLPAGFHSVKGLGKVAPDPSLDEKIDGDVLVPLGRPKDTGIKNQKGYTLNYNEYVVYDPCQVKTKYLVQLKFHFK